MKQVMRDMEILGELASRLTQKYVGVEFSWAGEMAALDVLCEHLSVGIRQRVASRPEVSRPALAEKATFFSSIRHHVAAMCITCEKAWHHLPVVLQAVIVGVPYVWLRGAEQSHISCMAVRAFASLGRQCVRASFIGLAPSVPYILLRSAEAQIATCHCITCRFLSRAA